MALYHRARPIRLQNVLTVKLFYYFTAVSVAICIIAWTRQMYLLSDSAMF